MSVRILVADDERELRDLLVSFLKGEGYEAEGFADGETALAALRATAYDLVLTDLRMPNLDGVELLQQALEVYPDLMEPPRLRNGLEQRMPIGQSLDDVEQGPGRRTVFSHGLPNPHVRARPPKRKVGDACVPRRTATHDREGSL